MKAPNDQVEEQAPARSKASKQVVGKGAQVCATNRVIVSLFEADSRALAVIRELLGSARHDFTSRSDSMKIGLRLAAKAKPEELATLFEPVKAEDRRYRSEGGYFPKGFGLGLVFYLLTSL